MVDLVCDFLNLCLVYCMGVVGYVIRDEPDRIYFVDGTQGSSQPAYKQVATADRMYLEVVFVGDIIYIGE